MTDYTQLENEVNAQAEVIWDVASSVWEFAELGLQEEQSSAYESAVLEKNGFKISDRGIGGCDTSWIATWGSGSPALGILVEFDALPGLGNDTVPTKAPAKSGNTNGHGCGHNLIGAGAIGAALALKAHMKKDEDRRHDQGLRLPGGGTDRRQELHGPGRCLQGARCLSAQPSRHGQRRRLGWCLSPGMER